MPRALLLASSIIAVSLTAAQADPSRRAGPTAGGFAPALRSLDPPGAPRRFEQVRNAARFATAVVPVTVEFVETHQRVHTRQARPLRPLSVAPVDPNAVVSRTSSGRIFIGPAPGAYVATPEEVAHYKRLSQPYAPPSFHMVGAGGGQNMGAPVKLTYGVQPPRGFNPGPKVVWLDGREAATVGDGPAPNPHVHYLK